MNEDGAFNLPSLVPNYKWTHERTFKIMQADRAERTANQLCAGIHGYKANGEYQIYIDEGFRYAQIKECIFGSHEGHRHDQSIYSVLAKRYDLPYQSLNRFGEWRSIDYSPRQVLYVHRGTYYNIDGLVDKYDEPCSKGL